jgi:hypothetical protein
METSNWLHSGTIGDVIASIPAITEFWRQTGKRVVLHLEKDHPARYYEGATHPTRDGENKMVMLNQQVIDMLIPLLNEQEGIDHAKVWDGEDIKVDLNVIRQEPSLFMPNFSINRWYFYFYPDLTCDLSGVWLNVPDTDKNLARGKILITRTERYRNDDINYSFLKPFEEDLIFSGTMREYNIFCMTFGLRIPKLIINNFLHLAQAVKQCQFHITNQTAAFQMSEGLKKPRILELCRYAPNCIPIGQDAYDFFWQPGLEYSFHKLNKKAPEMEAFIEKIKQTNQK